MAAREKILELQSSIRSLVLERKALQARLSSDRRRKPFSPGDAPNKKLWTSKIVPTTKRQRSDTLPVDENEKVDTQAEPEPFVIEKRPRLSLDDSTLKRGKNLFGSLVGYLQKAKSQTDEEKTQKPAQLQKAVTEQVDHMLELERKNLAELRRRDFQERQKKGLARIREVQSKLRERESKMLELHLQEHFTWMKQFIHTQATPMIFWLPAKHNETTLKLQQATEQQIEQKLESIAERFASAALDEKWSENQVEDQNKEPPSDSIPDEEKSKIHSDLINDDDDDDDDDVNVNKGASYEKPSETLSPDESSGIEKLHDEQIATKE